MPAPLTIRAALVLLCVLVAHSKAQSLPFLTQRRINEYAAALDTARRTLIDDAGLRHPGELLAAYVRRIALPLPGEPPSAYQTREERYINVLSRAANATAALRRQPPLRETSAANLQLWRSATRSLIFLPQHTARMQKAWSAPRKPNQLPPTTFSTEMQESLRLVIVAQDSLRDVAP